MNNTFKHPRHQAGFSLGELGLVLLIVAIIAMFAYPKFIEYNDNVLAGEEADNIIQYVSKTKSAYSMDSNFGDVTTGTLINTGIFPASMIQGAIAVNNYQGTVTAAPFAIFSANDSVQFTSTNYSQAGCREVVPRIAAVARVITVNGTSVKTSTGPLVKATVGTACTVAVNEVMFTVSK